MTKSRKIALIGTGLASYGALRCLLDQEGIEIHVFDIGLTSREPWQTDLPVPNGKTCQGSYFCYGINDPRWNVRLLSERLCSSHALGGHSTVYSGSVLYPKDHDLADWPEEGRPRAIDYDAILRSMKIVHEDDDLSSLFPPIPTEGDLCASNLDKETAVLGLSRLAVEPSPGEGADLGRPFQTGPLFAELHRLGKITYHARCYVLRLHSLEQEVKIVYQREHDNTESSEPYDAVFLGSGCINTTGIVDRSLLGEGTREYRLKSTTLQILAFARLSVRPIARSLSRNIAVLPEFFIEINGRPTRGTWSHTQLSAINDQIIEAICSVTPRMIHPVVRMIRRLVYFGLCTTHSDAAGAITIRCTTTREGGHTVQIDEPPGAMAARGVARLIKAVVRNHWKELRMIPIPGGGVLADYFRGNKLGGWHVGGSIPMTGRGNDSPYCLPNGEINGLRGAFVLDSASFPSIPASTIALLSAANGHRVARQWLGSDTQHAKI
jgi:hypothetical protein